MGLPWAMPCTAGHSSQINQMESRARNCHRILFHTWDRELRETLKSQPWHWVEKNPCPALEKCIWRKQTAQGAGTQLCAVHRTERRSGFIHSPLSTEVCESRTEICGFTAHSNCSVCVILPQSPSDEGQTKLDMSVDEIKFAKL